MKRYIKSDKEYEAGGETFEGYMGATGWKGKNYDIHMDIKDIAKIIRSQFRKKFPNYKISVKISRFSGGESLTAKVWMHLSDLMPKDQFVKQASETPWNYSHGYWFGYPDANGRWQNIPAENLYNMSMEEKIEIFDRYYDYYINHYTNDEYADINYGAEPIPLLYDEPLKYVKGLIDSFNYDDSNSMVDYFNVNFYDHIYYAYAE